MSLPPSPCKPIESILCAAAPGPQGALNNVQAPPYAYLDLSNGLAQTPPPGRPVAALFQSVDSTRIAFDRQLTFVTTAGRTITYQFKLNKPGLVQYRLVTDVNEVIFSGYYPVFDAASTYSVSISKSCSGLQLGESAYALWYNATDIYGAKTTISIDSVNFA